MPKKILITEDHDLYRDGLKSLITSMYSKLEILEAADYSSTLEHLKNHKDIYFLLLDIKIPGTQGLDAIKNIRKRFPTLTIIIVSVVDFHESIDHMLALGANGFISKTTAKDNMIRAIKAILAGEQIVISEHDIRERIELSPRQTDTLRLMVEGKPNKEIAEFLGISNATVREHVSHIFRQLDVKNRTQAVLLAKKRGFFLDDWD